MYGAYTIAIEFHDEALAILTSLQLRWKRAYPVRMNSGERERTCFICEDLLALRNYISFQLRDKKQLNKS